MKELSINNFKEKVYYEKLSNGLDVYLLPTDVKNNYYVSLTTRFGGANTKFKVDDKTYEVPTGIAHFLEHKLFERNNNPFKFFSKSGTDVNAGTNIDHTSYYFFGNNDIYKNLKYFLKWIPTFKITEAQVEKEKGIILEEASMYKDSPDRVIYEKINQNTYVLHPYKDKVIGTDFDIKRITKENLELCYKSFYRPDNMFLVATGKFDKDEFIKIIKKELKSWKNPSNKVSLVEPIEPDNVKVEYEEINMNVEVPRVAISYKIRKDLFKSLELDEYALDYYLQMMLTLAFGSTSNFREEMLLKNLFVNFNDELSDIKDHYIINIFTTTSKQDEFLKEIDKYINKLKFNEEDFERIKKIWVASEVRLIDSVTGSARNIIYDVLDYKEYKNNKIKDCRNLKFTTLQEIIKQIDFKNKAVIVIKNSSNQK